MPKITFMGAGSTVFAKNVLGDAMVTPSLEDSVIYRAKIAGPEREVTNALRAMHGMKSVTATAEKEADATVYLLEGARGFDIRKPLFRLLAGANYPLLELAPTGTDLESIFIRLVERSDAADAPSVRK